MKIGIQFMILPIMALLLGSCGGGSSSGSSMGRSGVMEGELTLKITDAPVDNATAVWIQFAGVTIKPADESAFDIFFDVPLNINLLSLQSGKTDILLENVMLPAGKYNWMRLHVNAIRDDILDSYIELTDGSQHELNVPSGVNNGLKIITDINVKSNSNVNLVVDFDLRQSIVLHNGNYDLSPVLRLVDLDKTGSLTGVVDASSLISADCSDADPVTGNAVYVFPGNNVTPDDIDGDTVDPLATANVVLNIETGVYEYVVSYLDEGDYTVAFTCQADLDQPDTSETLVFFSIQNVEVEDNEDEVISVLR